MRSAMPWITWSICVPFVLFWSSFSLAQTVERQIVIALDDSGSMGNPDFSAGRPGNDPYRLSRFAAGALLSALPDDIAATVLTMTHNGIDSSPASKEAPLDPPELLSLGQNRSVIEQLLAAPKSGQPGAFTRHNFPATPCQRVLDGMVEQLNEHYRPGAQQTAIYLSDGACTDTFSTSDFLKRLHSQQEWERRGASELRNEADRSFRFFFICMGNETCSKPFEELAEQTGGASYSASRAASNPQPEELVQIFAQVVGRSIGLCPSEHSSKQRSEIPAFPGAMSTQLVAVPGRGESLAWSSEQVQHARSREHHWDGEVFRYYTGSLAAGHRAQMPPLNTAGAASWRLMAIPIYPSLQSKLRILDGPCAQFAGDYHPEAKAFSAAQGLPVGATLCAEVVLVGQSEQVLALDGLGRKIEGRLDYEHGGKREHVALRHAKDTTQERFLFELPSIDEGNWNFVARLDVSAECLGPQVRRSMSGSSMVITAPPVSYVARSVHFGVDLERADELNALEPSASTERTIRFSGNFEPKSELRIWRAGADLHANDPHACVQVYYGDLRVPYRSEAPLHVPITAGAGSLLSLRAGEDCGWDEDLNERGIKLAFRETSSGAETTHELRYVLRNELALPQLQLKLVPDGPMQTTALDFQTNFGRMVDYEATIRRETVNGPLPSTLLLDLVHVDAVPDHPRMRKKKDRQQSIRFSMPEGPSSAPIVVRGQAKACCASGVYRVPVELVRVDEHGGRGRPEPVWLEIELSERSWLVCWWRKILGALVIALILGLLWAIYRVWTNTILIQDGSANVPNSFNLTVVRRGKSIGVEREEQPVKLIGSGTRQLPSWLERKVQLMAVGFRHTIRGKKWFETYRFEISERGVGLPTAAFGVGGDLLNAKQAGIYLSATSGGNSLKLDGVRMYDLGYLVLREDEVDEALALLRQRAMDEENPLIVHAQKTCNLRGFLLVRKALPDLPDGENAGVAFSR